MDSEELDGCYTDTAEAKDKPFSETDGGGAKH